MKQQTDSETLKGRKKKKGYNFWKSRVAILVVLMLLF
jgi:hypothetical protein